MGLPENTIRYRLAMAKANRKEKKPAKHKLVRPEAVYTNRQHEDLIEYYLNLDI